MKLIANADDYGLSAGVNYGIIDAYQNGIVRSTTMMVAMPGEENAVELAEANPGLKIGIHLYLTAGKPLSENASTLTDDDGNFLKQDRFWGNMDLDPVEIEAEFRAQIDRFLSLGLELSHLDSHHHCYGHPLAAPIAKKLAEELNVPYRTVDSKEITDLGEFTYRFSDEFYGEVSEEMLLEIVDKDIAERGQNSILELMCHPAFIDPELHKASSYCLQRVKETEILNSSRLRAALEERGVELATYEAVRAQ